MGRSADELADSARQLVLHADFTCRAAQLLAERSRGRIERAQALMSNGARLLAGARDHAGLWGRPSSGRG